MKKKHSDSDIQQRIIRVLEVIERANKAMAFHSSFEASDELAIRQYQKIKDQASKELFDILAELGIMPPKAVAA